MVTDFRQVGHIDPDGSGALEQTTDLLHPQILTPDQPRHLWVQVCHTVLLLIGFTDDWWLKHNIQTHGLEKTQTHCEMNNEITLSLCVDNSVLL